MEPSFTILEHPSDVGLEARGRSLAGAFEQAALGLMSLILDPPPSGTSEARPLTLAAADTEQLLVRWLSEVLFLFDGEGFAPAAFEIHELTPGALRATIHGEPLAGHPHRGNLDIKAVTYHQLLVRRDRNGWRVRVFFDI